jgi:hypothetical protein
VEEEDGGSEMVVAARGLGVRLWLEVSWIYFGDGLAILRY